MIAPTPFVYAVTDGCPSGWTIDTSKGGNGIQQLQKVKLRLGSDMALIEGELQYKDFAGESGPIAPPKDRRLNLSDLYLYGNTKVSRSYVVQVKNCPDSTTFTMNFGSLKEWVGVNLILDNVNSTEWAPANEALFQDFLVARKLSDCLANKKMKLQKPGYIRANISGKTLSIFNILDFDGFSNENCDLRGALVLVDKTPNCRSMSSPSNGGPARTGITITIGSKCSFAFAFRDNVRTLNIFETFTIDSKNWITSITCTKGKTKKVIQGVPNPEFKLKCPSGYKLKK
jgi:hypothetical protein